jgi:hypothetical protein
MAIYSKALNWIREEWIRFGRKVDRVENKSEARHLQEYAWRGVGTIEGLTYRLEIIPYLHRSFFTFRRNGYC